MMRAALLASGLLLGCGTGDPAHDPDSDQDADTDTDTDTDTERPAICDAGQNVIFRGPGTAVAGCPWDRGCGVDEYLALPDLFPGQLTAVSDEDLEERLLSILAGEVPLDPQVTEADLPDRIRRDTRVDLLLNGIQDRPLELILLDESNDYSWRGEFEGEEPDMPNQQYLVTDPLVGSFELVVFRPPMDRGPGPFPVVVVAHGHGDYSWMHAARGQFGANFTQRDYILVVPSFRANEADYPETEVTRGLLRAGFSTMAVRMYEQLLARRVAGALPEADPCAPVGLVGHSGGSVAANLTVRVAPPHLAFEAYISDLTSQYINYETEWGVMLDETLPDLFPAWAAIDHLENSPVPVLEVPYGYPDGHDEMLAFFDDHLAM